MMHSGAGIGQWRWFVDDIDWLGIVVVGGLRVDGVQVKKAKGLEGDIYGFDGRLDMCVGVELVSVITKHEFPGI